MYYKGVYHLFYQYNPEAAVWRQNITWGHSISYDLINWVHIDHALEPSEPFDINGCWSGSTTFVSGEPLILYNGIDSQGRQVQNLAVPKNLSDPKLLEWVKSPRNPLMLPPEGIDPTSYRDPTTAWQGLDKIWRVIVGAEKNGLGLAFMHRSDDFVNWNITATPLHSSEKTIMWECPDFYPVKVNGNIGIDTSVQDTDLKHVLKVSYNSQDSYILGHFAAITDKFVVESDFLGGGLDRRYDYGKFYASKTFYDPVKKRRILWGWVNESDTETDWIQRGWSGIQSFPRSVLLSKNGKQLIQWPIEEIEKLRRKHVNFHGKKLQGGSVLEVSGITALQADVEVSFSLPNLEDAEVLDPAWVNPQFVCSTQGAFVQGKQGPFGLLVFASENLSEQTAIFFRIFNRDGNCIALMCSDQRRSSLRGGIDKTTYGTFVELNPLQKTIFKKLGPMQFDINHYPGGLPSLVPWEEAWTKTASIIFIDSPVGTGFSYSKTEAGWPSSDTSTSEQAYQFLVKWLLEHPKYLPLELFIGGDSYAGKFIPLVTQKVLEGNMAGARPSLNLKGYFAGSPAADETKNSNYKIVFAHKLALVSDELYERLKVSCNGTYVNVQPSNVECTKTLVTYDRLVQDIFSFDILEPNCALTLPRDPEKISSARRFLRKNSENNFLVGSPDGNLQRGRCRPFNYTLANIWSNDPRVIEALNIRKGTVTQWSRCNQSLSFTEDVESVIPVHKYLSKHDLNVLVTNGDRDMVVPHVATRAWVQELDLDVDSNWRPWFVDGQIAGYTEEYGYAASGYSLVYATVKGAGHPAAESYRKVCYHMFDRWIHTYPV